MATNHSDELGDLVSILLEDVARTDAARDLDDGPFARRQFVRAAFAAVEAVLFRLRVHLLAEAKRRRFDASVVCLLRDETYTIGKDGTIAATQRFASFEASVLFLVNLYVLPLREGRLAVKRDAKEWHDLKVALAVRNRITHPKREADLQISAKEMEATKRTVFWLFDTIHEADGRHIRRKREREEKRHDFAQKRHAHLIELIEKARAASEPG